MSEDAPDISTANTMRERADESRLKLWVVLGASRLVVTGVLAALFLGLFVLAGTVLYPPLQAAIESGDTIETMFSTMLSVLVTVVTLIVTINQLVISQENGPLGDQHLRMSDSMDFREFTSEMIGETAPSDPSAFLYALVEEAEKRASDLNDSVADGDDELQAQVAEFTDSLTGNAEKVQDQVEGAKFGSFDVLFAALNFNYSWKIFHVERMGDEFGDRLTDDQSRLMEDLKTVLSMFGPAREHIKTLYFQWALIDLSQLIVYATLPALLIAGVMLAFVGPETFPGFTAGVSHLLVVVALAFTLTLVPFFLFVAYVVRIATVAKRTLAIGPLILRDSQR